MRIEEEGLSAAEAAEAVLRDNLFGLELDPRCTQIAAFALAFDAWKASAATASCRSRTSPAPASPSKASSTTGAGWPGATTTCVAALDRLYELFQDAPELGCLIDPRAAADEGLGRSIPDRCLPPLDQALARRPMILLPPSSVPPPGHRQGRSAVGRRYWLVATNPPFLGRGKQAEPATP